ncbi:hypothetical protein PENTCL1PPCAC_18088, partial [Pristionchus entomophagus]
FLFSWLSSALLTPSWLKVAVEFPVFLSALRWRLSYSERESWMPCSEWIQRDLPSGFDDGIDLPNKPFFLVFNHFLV